MHVCIYIYIYIYTHTHIRTNTCYLLYQNGEVSPKVLQASSPTLCNLLGIPADSEGTHVLQKTRETMENLRTQNRSGAKAEFAKLMWRVAQVGHMYAHICMVVYTYIHMYVYTYQHMLTNRC
jgi:hypothetical protein